MKATLVASGNQKTLIDIIINGNLELARKLTTSIALNTENSQHAIKIRIWYLDQADKATAWNSYLHHIWPGSDLIFFLDGYVQPWADSFVKIANGITENQEALASSGVPTMGHSAQSLAKSMLQDGGIHGNLFAIRGSAFESLRKINFHLPVGIYRTDPLLGAVLAYNLDPKKNPWDIKGKIFVNAEASWSIPAQNVWSVGSFSSFLKRRIRQAQGKLENLAVKEHLAILNKSPGELPKRVDKLINKWINQNRIEVLSILLLNPLCLYALLKMYPAVKNLNEELTMEDQTLVAEGFYINE